MAKRITIMLDDALDKKLRVKQSKKIAATGASYSFSQCLNDVLEKCL
jgi:hypothetical protein